MLVCNMHSGTKFIMEDETTKHIYIRVNSQIHDVDGYVGLSDGWFYSFRTIDKTRVRGIVIQLAS